MFFAGPLSLLLMGVAYLYTFIIKLFFLPLTLVKRIIFSSAGYGRYGQNFGLMTIGKILTVLVMFFLLFNKEVFGGISYQWRQIVGGVSIGIACLSLFVTAQGFVKVFAQAAFWMLSIYLLSDGFFPGLLNSIRGKDAWPPSAQVAFGSQDTYKVPDLMTDSTSYLSMRRSGSPDLLREPGLGGGSAYSKYILKPLDSVLIFLGLRKNNSLFSDNLSPHSKGPLPDEAYFPPQKKKKHGPTILPQNFLGGK